MRFVLHQSSNSRRAPRPVLRRSSEIFCGHGARGQCVTYCISHPTAPGPLDRYHKNSGHREPVRRPVHPRVVSLALRAIHLLAISRFLGKHTGFPVENIPFPAKLTALPPHSRYRELNKPARRSKAAPPGIPAALRFILLPRPFRPFGLPAFLPRSENGARHNR